MPDLVVSAAFEFPFSSPSVEQGKSLSFADTTRLELSLGIGEHLFLFK